MTGHSKNEITGEACCCWRAREDQTVFTRTKLKTGLPVQRTSWLELRGRLGFESVMSDFCLLFLLQWLQVADKPAQVDLDVVQDAQLIRAALASTFLTDLSNKKDWISVRVCVCGLCVGYVEHVEQRLGIIYQDSKNQVMWWCSNDKLEVEYKQILYIYIHTHSINIKEVFFKSFSDKTRHL